MRPYTQSRTLLLLFVPFLRKRFLELPNSFSAAQLTLVTCHFKFWILPKRSRSTYKSKIPKLGTACGRRFFKYAKEKHLNGFYKDSAKFFLTIRGTKTVIVKITFKTAIYSNTNVFNYCTLYEEWKIYSFFNYSSSGCGTYGWDQFSNARVSTWEGQILIKALWHLHIAVHLAFLKLFISILNSKPVNDWWGLSKTR